MHSLSRAAGCVLSEVLWLISQILNAFSDLFLQKAKLVVLQIWFARHGTPEDDKGKTTKNGPPPTSMSEGHTKDILQVYDFDGEREKGIKTGWGYFRYASSLMFSVHFATECCTLSRPAEASLALPL